MSFFFGGGQKVKPQFTGLQTQTSTNAVPITLAYGQSRIAPNIIYQADFASHKHKQKAGKGGSVTSYTYSGTFILALGWGEINDVVRVWKDQSKETSYAAMGFTLFKGTNPQAPWGYLTTNHPTEALGYPDIAYLAAANYDLGQSNGLQQHSFEVQGLLWNTAVGGTVPDADPALLINDFLANPTHGVGFDLSVISGILSTVDAPTTGDSTFQTYCQAMGFGLSPGLVSQEEAGQVVERWAHLCNSAIVWTGYSLKFHPYGPDELTANGVTYLPDFPIRYELNDSHYIYNSGEDPLRINRKDPADAYNSMSIIIANRANEYNDLPVPWKDQGLIDQFGVRKADSTDTKEITTEAMAEVVVALMGARQAYIRNTFEFKLGPQYCLLEPMDILRCYDPRWGWQAVLITVIEEDEQDQLTITAEEYPESMGSTLTNVSQSGSNTPVNTAVPPGPVNPPIIFEPPSSLSAGAQVWAAVSGGDGTTYEPNWGGCNVWLSTDDITYIQIGVQDTAARMGKLTSTLATYGGSNPDTAHTLQVSLLMSNGDLIDSSAADAEVGSTVSYVGGELLSYEDVTLTGTATYDVDNLWRAQYGSIVGAHTSGADFARLDDNIFRYDLIADYVGVTLYLKFQSYNIFGGGTEDLSSCTAYTYVPTGAGFGGGTSGVPTTPTGFSGSAGTVYAKVTWTANPINDNVTGYQVWRATGASQPFGSASIVGTTPGSSTEYTDSSALGGQTYTYFLVAVNTQGSSNYTSGINLTPTALTVTEPFGYAFQKTPVVNKVLAYFDTPLAWSVPAGLADCQGTIGDNDIATAGAPSAQTDFDLQSPLGTSIGTMRFASGSLTATFIAAAGHSISTGQPHAIICPSNLNGLTGLVYGSIKGIR